MKKIINGKYVLFVAIQVNIHENQIHSKNIKGSENEKIVNLTDNMQNEANIKFIFSYFLCSLR